MRPEEFYLQDIITACTAAKRYVSSISKQDFEKNVMIQQAVLFNLMIVGEAVAQISSSLKSRYPSVDWQSIKGFRNIITHEYFSLNLDIVWDSAQNDSIILIQEISSILATEYPDFPLPTTI